MTTSVYRFQNANSPGTFLFVGEAERQSILQNFPQFVEEGFGFSVFTAPEDGLIPVSRFQNSSVPGTYVFASEEESMDIRQNSPNFVEEGIAFYAYPADGDIGEDIFRFESILIPETFVYVDEVARQDILTNYSNYFVENGVVFKVPSVGNDLIQPLFLNDPPIVNEAIADQTTLEDSVFNFAIPNNTFTDEDGDTLTYTATLADGSDLPQWLSFDGTTFTGTPDNNDVGSIELKVTADDGNGGTVDDTFTLTIENVNDAPIVILPTTASEFFDLTSDGTNTTIRGTLAQLNEDIVEGFDRTDKITVQDSVLSADQLQVTFGSAILEIDSNNDGNTDSTITLEGDFTDALFFVNQRENSTDISYDVFSTAMYRFQNQDIPGTYLFAGEEESQSIRANFPNFKEEGLAFKVGNEGDNLIRINRFQNMNNSGAYLFATEEESQSIRANFPNFKEEGIAFYAAAPGSSTGESIYRFQSLSNPGTYIFVGGEERQSIIDNFSSAFVEEGIAFELLA